MHANPKKLAKAILPSGYKDESWGGGCVYRWHKAHGHAGSGMIDRAVDKALKLGFVTGPFDTHSTPDGGMMGSSTIYSHPSGWEMVTIATYGCVAYDNRFSITLKKV